MYYIHLGSSPDQPLGPFGEQEAYETAGRLLADGTQTVTVISALDEPATDQAVKIRHREPEFGQEQIKVALALQRADQASQEAWEKASALAAQVEQAEKANGIKGDNKAQMRKVLEWIAADVPVGAVLAAYDAVLLGQEGSEVRLMAALEALKQAVPHD